MTIRANPRSTETASLRAAPGRSRLLQRKCACGAGTSNLIGECEACSKKKTAGLQTKLRINEPGDAYEQEAERVAAEVLAKPAHPHVVSAPHIQRFSGPSNAETAAAPASVQHRSSEPGLNAPPIVE